MRTAVILGMGLVVALVFVAIAAADALVSSDDRAVSVRVRAVAGPDGNHGLIIEGFQEQGGRDGWRVRQDRFGRPAIVDDGRDCSGNVLFNDVVCSPLPFLARQSVTVTGGDGDDLVVLSEFAGGRETGTIAVQIPFPFPLDSPVSLPNPAGCPQDPTRNEGTARVDLGAGADTVAVVEATQRCSASFLSRLINARGGPGNDRMLGGPLADELFGDGDLDMLKGAGGDDILDGGAGTDLLFGDVGRETLRGGAQNDTLFARDEGFDNISCGTGVDHVEVDLVDFFKTPTSPRNTNGSDCETFDATPFDDGLPGHAVGRTLKRLSNGTGTIRVACPRTARVSCRGTLTVRLGRAYGRVIARARYTAPLGKQTTVRVALGSARRGAKVFAHTVEQGVSKKGPRYSMRLLVIR